MDFKDTVLQFSARVDKLLAQIKTEEATKNALIMPFIQLLGYDVFNPFEVNPEFVADLGIKKGEKVDYAIIKDGEPIILIECKHHLEKLDPHNSQLFRYFHVSKAKFGLLTNGITYRFYTDLIEPNKMDEKPFFEFSLPSIKDTDIIELRKFHKSYFNLESISNTASELKYSKEIKAILSEELKNPSVPFVKFFVSQVYNGKGTEKVVMQFTEIVKKSASQLISDLISDRLLSALEKENESSKHELENQVSLSKDDAELPTRDIITTDEEQEGYHIVKAILRQKVSAERIVARDNKSYFGVLLDDNNRKPICRLYFNGGKKFIELFDDQKKSVKKEIKSLDEIFSFSEDLLKTTDYYGN